MSGHLIIDTEDALERHWFVCLQRATARKDVCYETAMRIFRIDIRPRIQTLSADFTADDVHQKNTNDIQLRAEFVGRYISETTL